MPDCVSLARKTSVGRPVETREYAGERRPAALRATKLGAHGEDRPAHQHAPVLRRLQYRILGSSQAYKRSTNTLKKTMKNVA